MFHICFCANESYIKYTAVLINSIVKNTDTTKAFADFFTKNPPPHLDSYKKRDFALLSDDEKIEGYVFHILSDFVSEDSRYNLTNLAKELSKIYPCEIQIHICESTLFSGLPTLNGNYLTYFRFFIPRFMPKDCVVCLYLDIDMLVVGDLRGLFVLDMSEKCVGVVKDYILNNAMKKRPTLLPKTADLSSIRFTGSHFNAGFMLINLNAWERENITAQCFEVMRNYHLDMHDQDTLNAVIIEQNRLKLPFAFNCLPRAFLQSICNDESPHFKFDYTRESMNFSLKNPMILHFTSGIQKAWQGVNIKNQNGQILSDLWWEVALNTPNFDEILRGEFEALKQNPRKIFESQSAVYLLGFTQNFWGFFALPFMAQKIFGKNAREVLATRELQDSHSLNPCDYNLAFEIFALIQKSWQRRKKGDLLILPFRAIKLKFRHKRYGIARIL